MTIRKVCAAFTALALVALASSTFAVAAGAANTLQKTSFRSAFDGAQFIVEVVLDKPMRDGRIRQERYWQKTADGLVLIGTATIRYVDTNRNGQPDSDEVLHFSLN